MIVSPTGPFRKQNIKMQPNAQCLRSTGEAPQGDDS